MVKFQWCRTYRAFILCQASPVIVLKVNVLLWEPLIGYGAPPDAAMRMIRIPGYTQSQNLTRLIHHPTDMKCLT
jgi:hypothetical protein